MKVKESAMEYARNPQGVFMDVEQAKLGKLFSEFVQNAIEGQATKCVIDYESRGGYRKITFTDNGVGMSPEHMRDHLLMLRNSSKETSAKGNRGIGARVTGLKASPSGIEFHSAEKAGAKIHVAKMRMDYKAREIKKSLEQTSKRAIAPFTKVVLLGEEYSADTWARPYDGAESKASGIRDITNTFYRFPDGFEVLAPHATDSNNTAVATFESALGEHITSTREGGITYHWVDVRQVAAKNEQISLGGVLRTVPKTGGLVHQNRMFDVSRGKQSWASQASHLGLSLVSSDVMLFIELDEEYGVQPCVNRYDLTYSATLSDWQKKSETVKMSDFCESSIKHQPGWVRDLIKERRDKLSNRGLARDLYRELAAKYALMVKRPSLDPDGDETSGSEPGDDPAGRPEKEESKEKQERKGAVGTGDNRAKKRVLPANLDVDFKILWKEDEHWSTFFGEEPLKPINANEAGQGDVYINGEDKMLRDLYAQGVAEMHGMELELKAEYQAAFEKHVVERVIVPYWFRIALEANMEGDSHEKHMRRVSNSTHRGALAGVVNLVVDGDMVKLAKLLYTQLGRYAA